MADIEVQARGDDGTSSKAAGRGVASLSVRHGSTTCTATILDSAASAIEAMAKADPADSKAIGIAQIEVLTNYYQTALDQSKESFKFAKWLSIIGFVSFLVAIIIVWYFNLHDAAAITVLASALVQVGASITAFYTRASTQLVDFAQLIAQFQRYLLANSISESLDGELKNKTRAEVAVAIAKGTALPSAKKDDVAS